MSAAKISLPRALHRQLRTRVDAWNDRIAQATAIDRHREIARAARNVHLWLMIARRLGWGVPIPEGLPGNKDSGEEEIVITGGLARAIRTLGEYPWPETAQDWSRMRAASAALLAHAREACDDSEAAVQRLHEARAIDFHLELLQPDFPAAADEPVQQEAA